MLNGVGPAGYPPSHVAKKKRSASKAPPARARLDLAQAFELDARTLVESRTKSLVSHGTRNIRSAGDEVEVPFRKVLRGRLPKAYHVGHGHIVDSKLSVSPQVDVIVADAETVPVLMCNVDGNEYVPFESVYAIGEVKSSFDPRKKPVHTFCDTLDCLTQDLERATVSIPTRHAFGPSRDNPLFSFMIFVESSAYAWRHLEGLFKERPIERLPSVVCLLDRGLLLFARGIEDNDSLYLDDVPGHIWNLYDKDTGWSFLALNEASYPAGARFATLYMLLMRHLSRTRLETPDLSRYLKSAPLAHSNRELLVPVRLSFPD